MIRDRTTRAIRPACCLGVGVLFFWGCDPPGVDLVDVPQPEVEAAEDGGQGTFGNSLRGAMTTAIQDEYRAQFTYAGVLATLGPDVGPFDNIVLAEARHVASVATLFSTREWPIPESEWDLTNVATFSTRAEACAGGVEAEVLNVSMYDELLGRKLPLDVRTVFENLRAASLNHHLPAFLACSVGDPEDRTG